MISDFLGKVRRAAGKRPSYVLRRIGLELLASAERWRGPLRCRRLSLQTLVKNAGHASVAAWWQALAALPYPGKDFDATLFDEIAPGARTLIILRAEDALRHRVDLLGSGPMGLGAQIDWHTDFKSGVSWAPRFHRDISYIQLDQRSDVKVPWELSRMQWALPLAQAWRLTGDERYAEAARELFRQWIDANPYGASVNWACTMEPALRILSWTWMFHAFHAAPSWQDDGFRGSFLRSLWLHADFVARNLEEADINGNHYSADAAGLVYAGLFFRGAPDARRWLDRGWQILRAELPRQVSDDGVDFEASVPYHRLVTELFLYPAVYRLAHGFEVPDEYRTRLLTMGDYIAAYSRVDGSTPWWGDADDGRALAFGVQPLQEHRYLLGVLASVFDHGGARAAFAGPRDEVAWLLGSAPASRLPVRTGGPPTWSRSFSQGGFHVLRHANHHVFIDCGPIGLAGRGGHGHNDLLSFEAVLDGVKLVTDCGAYLYTASAEERNLFRSTACHNTPRVDAQEINRFVRPDYLWTLHDDARHQVLRFECDATRSVFEGCHTGYARLAAALIVRRRIVLDHVAGVLEVHDGFDGDGTHCIETPLHLAPGVVATRATERGWQLSAEGREFLLTWAGEGWTSQLDAGRASPSYGVVDHIAVLRFCLSGTPAELHLRLERCA